ncbi:unnamed protein product [Musa acuminata var. zebrina]
MLTSSNRSTRCHQASVFSHSTSSVEKLLFLSVHLPRGQTLEDITTVEGYTDIIVSLICFTIRTTGEKILETSMNYDDIIVLTYQIRKYITSSENIP